ncbi:radical SAM protein [Candidatus Micrarchaeota archaeon]|nr:radical SAM protein [Candidatus Micrarchaeota archaeon]
MILKYGSILEGSTEYFNGKTAAIVFLGGCPFRCGYCFSAPLIIASEHSQQMDVKRFVEYFERKKAEFDAVVFTGAEPLHQAEPLIELCRQLKEREFLIRLETSGFYADHLERILPYVDNIALDIKTELDADQYAQLVGFRGEPATLMQDTFRSLIILREAKKERPDLFVEVRTTIIPGINDTPEIVNAITKDLVFADQYVLQQFTVEQTLINGDYARKGNTPKLKLIELAEVACQNVSRVVIRTKDDGEQVFQPGGPVTEEF